MTEEALRRIEEDVCAAVNEVFETFSPGSEKAIPGTLYSRKGNIPLAMNEARRFCVLVLKDFCHVSSPDIGRLTGMSTGAVKKIVRKVRHDSLHDPLSFAVYSAVLKIREEDTDNGK